MANGSGGPLLRFIRTIRSQGSDDGCSDRHLLARFAAQRDEAAFAAIVQRHGPMVLAVCRRLLRDAQQAEDAFQATFLVLVRKAGSLGKPDALGNWLYGVAYRTSLKIKGCLSRLHLREQALIHEPCAADGLDATSLLEMRSVLDQELLRLPERYRSAIVLCYLQGKTHEQAARELGCPRETISTRVMRGRERLRRRLVDRGICLSAGLLAVGLAESMARGSVPASLVGATVRAGLLYAAEKTVASAAWSSQAAFVELFVRSLFVGKLKIISAVAMTLALAGVGAGMVAQHGLGDLAPASCLLSQCVPDESLRSALVPKEDEGWLGVVLDGNQEAGPPAILSVLEYSPAEKADFQDGDRILQIGDREAKDVPTAIELVRALKPGQRTTVKIQRQDRDINIQVTVAKRPSEEILQEQGLLYENRVGGGHDCGENG